MKCQVLFSQLSVLFTWSLTLIYSVFNKVKLVEQKAKISVYAKQSPQGNLSLKYCGEYLAYRR